MMARWCAIQMNQSRISAIKSVKLPGHEVFKTMCYYIHYAYAGKDCLTCC